jgi:lactate permease
MSRGWAQGGALGAVFERLKGGRVSGGPVLTPLSWSLAALPILLVVFTLLALRWSAPRAGAAALVAALLLGWSAYGGGPTLLAVAMAKGLSLSLFVLAIVWASVFLYNLVADLGAVDVIGRGLASMSGDQVGKGLLIGWALSGFIQGVTGFGVPVAVVAPLMVMAGFPLTTSVVAVLVGHSWAVTFGSMGSSFYAIQLVTGIPGPEIGPPMAALFALPTVATGFAVAHIVGGMAGVRRGAGTVLVVGAVISAAVWLVARAGAPQVAAAVPALAGGVVAWAMLRRAGVRAPITAAAETINSPGTTGPSWSFGLALMPYLALIGLTLALQAPGLRELGRLLSWGPSFPSLETALGFQVEAVSGYAAISLLAHPAPLILASAGVTYLVLRRVGLWRSGAARRAVAATYRQSRSSTLGIATMVMMALVLVDTGMVGVLARGIAAATGGAFPFFSPFVGMLGAFLTGSNTNSNILFGALQVETARTLGVSAVVLASAQSIGGSLGSAIAPAKVMVGTALVGLAGRESEVMRRALPYCLALIALVGAEVWVVGMLGWWTGE